MGNRQTDTVEKAMTDKQPAPVDVETLKREVTTALTGRSDCGLLTDACRIIDHLHERGLLAPPPIKGLEEAWKNIKIQRGYVDNLPYHYYLDTESSDNLSRILEFVRAYLELTKGKG